MILGIFSDIHDNVWKLHEATALAQSEGVEHGIFCGDFCAPFTLKQLAEELAVPLEVVWGNNDGDKWLLTSIASGFKGVTLHGEFAELSLGGIRIAINHYPELGRALAASGKYDLVCYGHDHQGLIEPQTNGCLLVNPGEIMGRFGRCTFAVYDTETRTARHLEAGTMP